LLFNLFHSKIPNAYRVQPLLIFLLRMYLGWIIMGYGMAKVFAGQFPMLMANMDARFVELTPMRVAWAFFGYSKGYQMFLGWGEVIPAVLILFRRTTLLGTILMVTVMLNVWLVNIFFDVCVKLNSFTYMIVGVYILLQYTNRLWKFFFTNQAVPAAYYPDLADKKVFQRIGLTINIILVSFILYFPLVTFYDYFVTPEVPKYKSLLYGAWKIQKIEKWDGNNWVIPAPADSCNFNRSFFEGSTGVLQSDLKRQRFGYSVDSAKKELTLDFINDRNTRYEKQVWQFAKPDLDNISLIGRWGKDSIRTEWLLRKETLLRK